MILIMILILILIMIQIKILILILIMILIMILILILILSVNLSLCCGSSGTGGKRAQKERKKIRGKNLPRRRKRVLTKEMGWCTMVIHTVIVCPFMPSPIT